MSNPNYPTQAQNDAKYATPASVTSAIATQATTDAGQYTQQWKANTAYSANQIVIAPDGSTVSAVSSFTSGASYNTSNWTTLSPNASSIASTYATQAVTTATNNAVNKLTLVPTTIKVASYTASAQDLVICDATSASFTVTLPGSPADGVQIDVKKIDSSTNTVTVTTNGSDLFSTGGNTLVLSIQGHAVTWRYQLSASKWIAINNDLPFAAVEGRYLTQANAGSTYAPLASPSITGTPTINGSAFLAPNTQVFTANGTWTKPSGCTLVMVTLIGGGAGGGSGARLASGTASSGGGGGSGGSYTYITMPASILPSTVSVTVGTAGVGGAAVTTDSTNGNNGTSGTSTSFGAYAAAGLGGGGSGGSNGSSAGGSGYPGTIGGGNGAGCTVGSGGGYGTRSTMGGSGGGAGGGNTSTTTANSGGVGINSWNYTAAGAGTAGSAGGGAGGNGGAVINNNPICGGSGGGGGASINSVGGAGGNGGLYGSAGGGGGASINGYASGAGGNGAPGIAVIVSI